jgi:glycosyltransferase involved in cell wall biosynthesis
MNTRGLIVIPAYNEADTIADVLLGLRRAAPELDRLVVTDGSRDATERIVTELGENRLSFLCNLGYGRALQAGIKYALARDYHHVVFFDGDGQHNPEDVPRLVRVLLEENADVVIGSRFGNGRPYAGPLSRRSGQILFSYFTRLLLKQRLYDTTSGLKAIRASACESLVRGTFLDFHTEALVRLGLLGLAIAEVPISVREREHGHSMYSLTSVVEYPIKTFLLSLLAILDVFLQRRTQ